MHQVWIGADDCLEAGDHTVWSTIQQGIEPQNTPMDANKCRLNPLSNRIIGCALKVQHILGTGFLEKVYQNALAHELRKAGLRVTQQHSMIVTYDNIVVGEYVADLLVEDVVLVELKAVRALDEIHFAQCLNYLKATATKLCLLMNFGTPRLQIKRFVLDL